MRAWGLNGPELSDPRGPPAKAAAARLINGKDLTCTVRGPKSFDREVALCLLPDGRGVAAEMIKQGAAQEYLRFSGGFYQGIGR